MQSVVSVYVHPAPDTSYNSNLKVTIKISKVKRGNKQYNARETNLSCLSTDTIFSFGIGQLNEKVYKYTVYVNKYSGNMWFTYIYIRIIAKS